MSDTNVHRVVGNLLVGTSHFFVDTTTNRVGVNTSSPSASLDIATGDLKVGSGITIGNNGTITAANFSGNGSGLSGINSDSGSWVKDDANGLVYVANSAHKVGIGLTSPDEKLDIDGGNIRLRSTGTAKIFNHSAGSDYGNLQISSGYQNDAAAPKIDLIGWTGAGTVDGDNLIKFSTNNSVRMCINQSGNVGCGTSSPQQNLHVHESGSGQVVIAVTNDTTGGGDNDGIHFGIDSSEQGFVWHKQNTALLFATNNAERMRLTNDGKLGIGTTSPSGVLHVVDSSANGSWNKLLIRPTTLWGDGVTTAAEDGGGAYRYMTMANIMLQNPHVCTSQVGGAAHIRIGRGGGVSTGEWWDLATRTDNKFHICKGADDTKGIVIDTSGRVGFGVTEKRNLYLNPPAWSYNTTSTSDTTLWFFTYNFPYDGYVILNTNGHWRNTSHGQWLYAKLGIDNADPADTSGLYDSYTGGAHNNHSGDFHEYEENTGYWCDFNWGGTLKVSAGNRSICLRVRIQGGHVYINGTAINMFYIPTKIF